VIITLENGDQAKDGWDVEINGRKSGRHFGKTGVLTSIYPGLYQVVVSGSIRKKPVHAEAASKVTAGEVTNLQLKLT
jgi:hypothetical protein